MPYLSNINLSGYSDKELNLIIESVREGLTMLSELPAAAQFYFETKLDVPADLKETVLAKATARQVLDQTLERLSSFPWGDHKGCKAVIDGIGKDSGLKGKDLYWPLRVALSASVKGPDIGSIVSILGADRVRNRIESTPN
jgi:nondiscriminating glutamyl-tRNA synthetase